MALYVEASVPSKLSGCETTIERQTYQALHELEHRPAARRCLTPPYIVNVEVTRSPEPEWVPKPD